MGLVKLEMFFKLYGGMGLMKLSANRKRGRKRGETHWSKGGVLGRKPEGTGCKPHLTTSILGPF